MKRRLNDHMPNKYVTLKDLRDRLDQTICRYDGHLVWVRVKVIESEDDPKLVLYDWPKSSKVFKTIDPSDPLFDISLIDLGYFNYRQANQNIVIYPYRTASRKYKQGTSLGYTQTLTIDGTPSPYGGSTIQSPGFVDSVEGKYPSIDVLGTQGFSEVALSPDLACRIDPLGVQEFFWRCTKVAIKVPGQEVYKMDTEHRWMIEKVLGGLV